MAVYDMTMIFQSSGYTPYWWQSYLSFDKIYYGTNWKSSAKAGNLGTTGAFLNTGSTQALQVPGGSTAVGSAVWACGATGSTAHPFYQVSIAQRWTIGEWLKWFGDPSLRIIDKGWISNCTLSSELFH